MSKETNFDEHQGIAKDAKAIKDWMFGLGYSMTEARYAALVSTWDDTHKNFGAYRATDKRSVYPSDENILKYTAKGIDAYSIYARAQEITRQEAKRKMYWLFYSATTNSIKSIYTVLEESLLFKALRQKLIVSHADLNEVSYRYVWRSYEQR